MSGEADARSGSEEGRRHFDTLKAARRYARSRIAAGHHTAYVWACYTVTRPLGKLVAEYHSRARQRFYAAVARGEVMA
jgi:hypothetical protein